MAQISRGSQCGDITDDTTRSTNDNSASLKNIMETPVRHDALNDISRIISPDIEQAVKNRRPKEQAHKTTTSDTEPSAENATNEEPRQCLNTQSQCSKEQSSENAILGAKPDTANLSDREDDEEKILYVEKYRDFNLSLQDFFSHLSSKGEKAVQPNTNIVGKVLKCEHDATTKRLLEVTVISEPLKKLLAEALRHYPGHWDEGVSFASDGLSFAPLIHNWDKLQTLALETTTDEDTRLTREHLDLLLTKVGQSCKYLHSRKMICEDKIVSFDWLWTIFPPGSIVYEAESNQPRVLMVSSAEYTSKDRALFNWTERNEVKEFLLLCWDYGSSLKPV